MKTVGEILKKARLEKQLTLEQISRQTRIALKYLQAIEVNDYKQLPPATFTKGFIQNFAKAVDLNPINILAIFRRDYDQDDRGRIIARGLTEPVRAPVAFFNPTTTSIMLTAVIAVLIAGFFIRQIIIFASAPSISVIEPKEYAQTTSPVTISGQTQAQVALTINNRIVNVSETGQFTTQVNLPPGEHTLIITATSRSQKSTTLERSLTILK
jgi:cytoskeletal protein RodZ